MFQILLAEDNPGDVLLFREALTHCGVCCNIVVAVDGLSAIAMVENEASSTWRPDLIVLDIKLPKDNGDAVLRYVRSQPWLNRVPVIVLTSSASPADQAAAMDLGATLYLQKSSDLNQVLEFGRIVEEVLSRAETPET